MNIAQMFVFSRLPLFNMVRPKPTVKTDKKMLTLEVKKVVRISIAGLPDIPWRLRRWVFKVAIEAVQWGGGPNLLADKLIGANMLRVDEAKATAIAIYLHSRASSLMTKTRLMELGLTHDRWLHTGVPCFSHMEGYKALSEGHALAHDKLYKITDGLTINGVPTWPRLQAGCNCEVARQKWTER
jgi:hypothetical protein